MHPVRARLGIKGTLVGDWDLPPQKPIPAIWIVKRSCEPPGRMFCDPIRFVSALFQPAIRGRLPHENYSSRGIAASSQRHAAMTRLSRAVNPRFRNTRLTHRWISCLPPFDSRHPGHVLHGGVAPDLEAGASGDRGS